MAAHTQRMEICGVEAGGADAQSRTAKECAVFVPLKCKLPGYKKAERKGDVTTWKCAMYAFDEYI